MSEHSTLANSQMPTNVATNVDRSNPNDISNVFKYLLNTVNTLQEHVTTHDDILNELSTLRNENATLKAEIANLHAQLKSASAKLSTATDSNVASSSTIVDNPANQVSNVSVPTYSAVAARAGPKPVTKKRKLAAGRTFMPVDPSAPHGFEHLYLNRKRKLTRAEVRRNLRLLALDLSRVLDICFPGPKVVGLLIHVLYKEEEVSLFSAAKVPLVDGFDPLDPVNLADPELQLLRIHKIIVTLF